SSSPPIHPERSTQYASIEGTPSTPQLCRVLLLNDTGSLANPGCRAVRKAYKLMFQPHLTGMRIEASIPVNYWIDHFRHLAIPGKSTLLKEPGKFTMGAEMVADIDFDEWERVRSEIARDDKNLQTLLNNTDL